MNTQINPYIAGPHVGGTDKFIGRQDILSNVLRVLVNPNQNAIILFGQRRIGKTSILEELRDRLPNEGEYIPIYFNFEYRTTSPIEEVLTDLVKDITNKIAKTSTNVTERKEQTPAGLTRETFQEFFLKALKALPPNKSFVLLLDEFDLLGTSSLEQEDWNQAMTKCLASLVNMNDQRLQFVFVIGRPVDDWSSGMTYIFRKAETQLVSLLSDEETRTLVRFSEKNNSLVWSEKAVERLWALTNGHPYLTQQLCAIIWFHAKQSQADRVSVEMVDQAIPTLFERSLSALLWLWNGLPPAERVVAWVLAEAEADVVSQEEVEAALSNYGVQAITRELKKALQTLSRWDVVEEINGGYRFRVELLRRWLIDYYKPLERHVQEELAKMESKAEMLYQKALQEQKVDHWTNADKLLQSSIEINPNHFKAHLARGQGLLKRGEINKAITELNMAYEQAPIASKEAYVTTLLKVAENSNFPLLTRWEVCQRILQIQPNHSEALKVLSKVREREQREQKAKQHEMSAEWTAAIQIYEQLESDSYKDKEKWQEPLQKARQQQSVRNLYKEGLQALEEGDRKKTISILSNLLSVQPDSELARQLLVPVLQDSSPRIIASSQTIEGGGRLLTSNIYWLAFLLFFIMLCFFYLFFNFF